MPEIDDLLKDRGSRYGDFGVQSQTAQAIREAFQTGDNWDDLPAYMREGLDLVATKLSRMLCGDFMYMDNVVDIIGYMTLVKTEMEKEHARNEKFNEYVKAQSEAPLGMPAIKTEDPNWFGSGSNNGHDEELGNPIRWRGPYSNS